MGVLRVVDFRKAVLAGAAGALIWEMAIRALVLSGIPTFDMVRELGTLVAPQGDPAKWWPAGILIHVTVGAAWAISYAYFFWARFNWPPPLQGLAFALVPAVLATFLVYPQLQLMRLDAEMVHVDWHTFVTGLEPALFGGLLLGHALFGLTVGFLYTRPVGYRADRTVKRPRHRRRSRTTERPPALANAFIFATGIEASYPTTGAGRWRRDEMMDTRHYERWGEDFALARQVGVSHIRYGPPLHLIFLGPGRFDWSWIDQPMRELEQSGPEPIVDLCHFGVPTWLDNFQNDEIEPALAEYAGAFARRYPWVRFYTPINEMYVCARMSALQGLWNEELNDDGAFLHAAVNMAGASVGMTDAILDARPDAVLIHSESSEFHQPCCPDPEIQRIAELENERRFLPLDLIYRHEVAETMRAHLSEHGVTPEAYGRFMNRDVPRRTVLGIDYYEWNERLIDYDGRAIALGEMFGWYVIASQYWRRYGRPLMYTETNRSDARQAPAWLWRQWHNVQLLRQSGVPLIGFTWYSLIDQIDWDHAIDQPLGIVNPVGLFDLNRNPRAVGLSYKHLIDTYRDLPEYRQCPAMAEMLS